MADDSMGSLNISGRNLNDAILVLDVDELRADAPVEPRILAMPGFPGTAGDGRINVAGFTGTDDADGTIRLWIPDLKPSVDPVTGEILDQTKVGGNTTVELFRTGSRAAELTHVKTFAHAQISSPNRVAAVGGDSNAFYYTNDHGTVKLGLVSCNTRICLRVCKC